ncbi:MAG: long-chain-fatty-acid--CoA ligase [Gammaproteobacteria bacterium RIFCSPHIGHO2_12_FULL_41_15]|nr:MAG: long-chain-fatty-acid--CoA ligase [Gammaproteobacteria bacterium RIFCSPHIGHO2_12_FULL_41_15]
MEKIWLKNYAPDVPATIDPNEYQSLAELISRVAERFGDLPGYTNMGQTYSYAKMDQLSRQIAGFFQEKLKLKKGDRLAIMLPNTLQFIAVMLAALRVGIVVVNVNPLYTAHELEHQLNDSGSKAVIVLANFANMLEKAKPTLRSVEYIIVTQLGDMFSGLKGLLTNWVVRRIKKMVPAYKLPESISFKRLLQLSKKTKLTPVTVDSEDIAFLQYTGGTTGLAKGAVLSHRNMVSNILQIKAVMNSQIEDGKEHIITALPLYHIFSLTVCCFCFMACGGEQTLVTNPRDLPNFLKLLASRPFSFFVGVNSLFHALNQQAGFANIDFTDLKMTIAGGMAVQESVAHKWHEITGKLITEGYGLTEASPVVSVNPVYVKQFNASIGLPLPSTDITIRDKLGQEQPIGGEGELWVRGPQVMKGYWSLPRASHDVITEDGWLKTGDVARIDEEGFLYLVDRIKDMLIVSGFNVYPNEVENVLASYPGVSEVAVIGVPSERTGQAVKAIIVATEKIDETDLKAYCRQRLTAYKTPKIIEFRESLPKSNVGKVLRRELHEPA